MMTLALTYLIRADREHEAEKYLRESFGETPYEPGRQAYGVHSPRGQVSRYALGA